MGCSCGGGAAGWSSDRSALDEGEGTATTGTACAKLERARDGGMCGLLHARRVCVVEESRSKTPGPDLVNLGGTNASQLFLAGQGLNRTDPRKPRDNRPSRIYRALQRPKHHGVAIAAVVSTLILGHGHRSPPHVCAHHLRGRQLLKLAGSACLCRAASLWWATQLCKPAATLPAAAAAHIPHRIIL